MSVPVYDNSSFVRPAESEFRTESSSRSVHNFLREGNFLSAISTLPDYPRARLQARSFFYISKHLRSRTQAIGRGTQLGGSSSRSRRDTSATGSCDPSYRSPRTYDDGLTSDESCDRVTFFSPRASPRPFIARRAAGSRIFDEFDLALRVRGSPHPRGNFKVTRRALIDSI